MLTRVRIPCSVLYVVLIGLILVVPDTAEAVTWIVDDDGVQCPARDFSSIQAAINAAGPGDTIDVCPGTYVENIVLAKSLTVLGAQAGVNACGRTAVDESVVTPLLPAVMTVELDTGSAGSIINGFTFLGGTRAIVSDTGPIDGLQLLNNRITQFTGNGVFLDDNGLNITVDQNAIDGSSKVGGGGLFHLDQDNFDGFWFTNNCVMNGTTGTGFFVDGNRNVDKNTPGARIPSFTGNVIDNNGTGVNLGSRSWGDGPITSNTFSNNRFDGLQGGPRDSRIEVNWFDNNRRSGLAFTSFGNTASDRGAQNNRVELNCFTRNGTTPASGEGIFLSASQAAGTIASNEIHQNNIIGNMTGMRYLGVETIDAELNWWNSPTGPTHPNNPGGTGDSVVDDGNGVDYDPWRTTAVAGTPCGVGPATTVTLEPETATNPVDTMHCVTATVTNAFGIPQTGVDVQFTVTGSVNDSGVDTTDGNGEAEFCYQGPPLPGSDVITATADADGDGFDPGDPMDTATKTWILPLTTPGCEIIITNGGWIIADNGDRASFGGNAKSDEESNVSGQEQYQDHGPVEPFNLHGTPTVIVCGDDGTSATIFGDATIDGTGSYIFRIDVQDNGEPGRGVDHYRIQVDTYDSGDHTLEGGNVQIRREQ